MHYLWSQEHTISFQELLLYMCIVVKHIRFLLKFFVVNEHVLTTVVNSICNLSAIVPKLYGDYWQTNYYSSSLSYLDIYIYIYGTSQRLHNNLSIYDIFHNIFTPYESLWMVLFCPLTSVPICIGQRKGFE